MFSSWWPAVLQIIEKTSNENHVRKLLFLFPFLPAVLPLRDASKSILNKPKWGGTSSRRGDGAPGPTVAKASLAPPQWRHWLPVQKMIPHWLILWTHGKKQQSHTLNQGCKFELKLKKSRLFCRTRKKSFDSNLNQVKPASNSLSRRAPYPSYFCSHTTLWI